MLRFADDASGLREASCILPRELCHRVNHRLWPALDGMRVRSEQSLDTRRAGQLGQPTAHVVAARVVLGRLGDGAEVPLLWVAADASKVGPVAIVGADLSTPAWMR